MTNFDQNSGKHTMNRRVFLQTLSATVAGITATAVAQPALVKPSAVASLRLAAQQSGKVLGMYTVQYQLLHDPQATAMIAEGFSLIADGNDLKFSDRLRPSPDTFNFSLGDIAVNWAQQHHKLFRGHCLIWWNGLPKWFNSYVNQKNAEQVMTKHISTVVKHYAGRVYAWDVVNEPLHGDGRPDGLRRKPWVDLLGGPQYIDIAFHTAADADPGARRVLNECYIEHNTPGEIGRRATLLALATRLKKSGVPITTIGLQGHLRGATPLDGPGLTKFMQQVQDLGLDIMVTELDVDDVDVPEPKIEQTVADKYSQFLDIVSPYVRVITFEGLQDDPAALHTHNLFLHNKDASGSAYMTARAFGPALTALQRPGGNRRSPAVAPTSSPASRTSAH
jgi:endo-1,4-beta-xylanase